MNPFPITIDLPPHPPFPEFNDNDPGCMPCLIDGATQRPFDDNDPRLVAIHKAWKEQTSLEERKSFYDCCCQNSRDPADLGRMPRLIKLIEQAMLSVVTTKQVVVAIDNNNNGSSA